MYGAAGADLSIPVPLGTVVWRVQDGERVLAGEVLEQDEQLVVARGGAGGRGNTHFVSPTNQVPLLVERGEAGERWELFLELKLIADIGIVGKPNAGKSTLLAAYSRARPKAAPYPFTTLEPVLGVVRIFDRAYVMVEIPGIIEGAHAGAGLGLDFLRHAERTRIIFQLVDGSEPDVMAEINQIDEELRLFGQTLAAKPRFLVVNKTDIPEVAERIPELRALLEPLGRPLFFISGAAHDGLDALLAKAAEVLSTMPRETREPVAPRADSKGLAPQRGTSRADPVHIEQRGKVFVVVSARAERVVALADLDDQRVQAQLMQELRRMGVAQALEAAGVEPGNKVRIGQTTLEW